MPRLQTYALMFLIILVLGLAAIATTSSQHARGYETHCEHQNANDKNCATDNVTLVFLWKIGKAFDAHNGAVAAAAGILVAVFTFTLWQVTGKLWRSAENQLAAFQKSLVHAEATAAAAMQQADIARKTLSASLRPWVKAELVLRGPIVWTGQGGSIMLVVKMINVGNVPALGVDIEVDARSPMEGDLPAEQIAFADKFRRKSNIGFTMFPNDPFIRDYTIHIGQTEMARAKSYWHDKKGLDRDVLRVTLFGCVTYWSAIDDTICQTGLIYKVQRRPDANNSTAISPTRGDVPLEALSLERWPQEGRTD